MGNFFGSPNDPIMELALLEVKPGREQEFEAAFGSAQQINAGMLGYLEHSLYRTRSGVITGETNLAGWS